jgi:hypothetical protein
MAQDFLIDKEFEGNQKSALVLEGTFFHGYYLVKLLTNSSVREKKSGQRFLIPSD